MYLYRPYCMAATAWVKVYMYEFQFLHFFALSQNFILLFKELPLHLWLPESHDMHVIHNMLTECPLSSCENLLARVILSGLNWGTKSEVSKFGMNFTRVQWQSKASMYVLPYHYCIIELKVQFYDCWHGLLGPTLCLYT